MEKIPTREELVFSWQQQYYFNRNSTRTAVQEGLHRLIEDIQLEHFAVFLLRITHDRSADLRPPEAFTSYPRAWIEYYIRRSFYLADPIFHEARRTNRPFYWGLNLFLEPYLPRQRRVMEEASAHGIQFGFAIPVHGPLGSFGVFILANEDPVWLRRVTCRERERLHAVALDMHEYLLERALRKVRKVEDALSLRNPGLLPPREREALLWTLEGHPAKAVGLRMGLTTYTVHRYLSDAQQRLGCGTKNEAAVRAYRSGLLHESPWTNPRRRRLRRPATITMGEPGGLKIRGTVVMDGDPEVDGD